jgi:hypothetical protein
MDCNPALHRVDVDTVADEKQRKRPVTSSLDFGSVQRLIAGGDVFLASRLQL